MIWTVVGGLGAACFFSRFLVQWLASERAQRSVSPVSFWWLSLAGAVLMGSAALAQGEALLLAGYLVTAAIYVRNLLLPRRGSSSSLGPLPAALIGLAAAAVLVASVGASTPAGSESAAWILGVGVVGQTIWSLRFLVQWFFTERRGYSHFPIAFWWTTLLGSLLMLVYTGSLVGSGGPSRIVYFVSFLPTPLYPIRNLILEFRHRRRAGAARASGAAAETAQALRTVPREGPPRGAVAPRGTAGPPPR